MTGAPDPYRVLGVRRSASDRELRAAYRRLVQRHHPDHNQGSADSARRFEAVQEAYARVRRERTGSDATAAPPTEPPGDPRFEARLAEMERELKAARQAKEKAMREAARRAARRPRPREPDHPSDEELGYVSTDDSFTKIFDDLAAGVSARFAEARDPGNAHDPHGAPIKRRVSDLIDELGSKLTGEPPDRDATGR